MKLIEKKMNLFEVDSKYYFAHCISADVGINPKAMGLGIVVEFNKRFHMKSKVQQYAQTEQICVDDSILIDKVFNLITKSKYYGKPTYNTLITALENMKKQIINNQIKYIAIPKLGCGLDRLSWGKAREIIQKLFKDIDIEVLVCSL